MYLLFILFSLTRSLLFLTERPLHHCEKILEQVLEWSTLDCPSSAFLVIKKYAGAKTVADGKGTECKQLHKATKMLTAELVYVFFPHIHCYCKFFIIDSTAESHDCFHDHSEHQV